MYPNFPSLKPSFQGFRGCISIRASTVSYQRREERNEQGEQLQIAKHVARYMSEAGELEERRDKPSPSVDDMRPAPANERPVLQSTYSRLSLQRGSKLPCHVNTKQLLTRWCMDTSLSCLQTLATSFSISSQTELYFPQAMTSYLFFWTVGYLPTSRSAC